ncbi:prepilin peptidase [Candidatus Berkelbacteria bacterium]|nr:prepilin peptidase [Candidatus Berkelbacteria bacterium]
MANPLVWINSGFFIFGLLVGSFLNVVIARFEKPKTILKGRSKCDACGHTLGFWDLIPLFSFLFLKGHCRYCGKLISWQNPVVELATGFLFLGLFWKFGFSIALILYCFLALLLLALFFIDLKNMLIPDWLAWPAIFFSLAAVLFPFSPLSPLSTFSTFPIFFPSFPFSTLLNPFFGLLIGAGILALLVLFSRGRFMGSGDIYFGAILGLLSSYPLILLSLPLSFFLGGLIASILLLTKTRGLKDPIPFAPFLIISIFVVLFLREGLETLFRLYFPF